MLIVERGTPTHPQAAALLQHSHALMQSLFNPEDNHYLSIDALCAPHIRFFMARRGDQVLGTGALHLLVGVAVGSVVAMGFNFWVSRRWVFAAR